jgi:hypothetical protein
MWALRGPLRMCDELFAAVARDHLQPIDEIA